MKKLSPAHVKVLRALAEPGAKAFGTHHCFDWVLTNDPRRVSLPTLNRLMREGLISIPKTFSERESTITLAGRAYLAELDKEVP